MIDKVVLNLAQEYIKKTWPTGIAFMQISGNTLIVDWVDGRSTEITVTADHVTAKR